MNVCQEATFQVVADDHNKQDDVSIFVLEDPGLPNGAVVSSNVCPAPIPQNEGDTIRLVKLPCNPVTRHFSWTPAKTQEGKTYRVCFIARDNQFFCQDGGYYSLLMFDNNDMCVQIRVRAPGPTWVSPPTPTHNSNLVANNPTLFDDEERSGKPRTLR